MTSACDVAVVVLNYRGAEDTLECLASLSRLATAPATIRVIDNASGDDSPDRIRQAFPHIELTENSRNLGFGAGHNAIIAQLLDHGHKWLWLLNNDARSRPDTLDRMLETAGENPRIGAVGAIVRHLQPPHAIQVAGGGHIDWWLGRSREWCPREGVSFPPRPLDYISGTCMLLNARALRQIGLFDHNFFMYWEDADLCLRLRQSSWDLAIAERAEVLHRLSSSTGEGSTAKDALINASAARFFRKHGPLGGCPPIIFGTAARAAKRLLTARPAAALAVLRGTLNGLRRSE